MSFRDTAMSDGRQNQTQPDIRMIPLNAIVFSPFQARRYFDEQELAGLAESVRENGVLQPILVRPFNKGYELVAGERRVRACSLLGIDSIPAVVRDMNDREVALAGLVENLQRQGLDPIEEAEGYKRLLDEFGVTQEAVAKQVGKSQSSVANKLRLLRLSQRIRDAISREIITERHARSLLSIHDETVRQKAYEHITSVGLNVRQTDEYIRLLLDDEPDPKQREPRRKIAVVKDLRIFLNAFRHAVRALRQAGIEAAMDEQDEGEYIRLTVTVAKNRTGKLEA